MRFDNSVRFTMPLHSRLNCFSALRWLVLQALGRMRLPFGAGVTELANQPDPQRIFQ